MTASIEIPALDSREKFDEFVRVAKIGGGVKYESLRESFERTIRGMKRVHEKASIVVEPALAVSRGLFTRENEGDIKCKPMQSIPGLVSAFQAIRHGVIMTTDNGGVYYVGGRSPYWILKTGLYIWSFWPPTSYLAFNPYEGDLSERFSFHYMACEGENSFNYPGLIALRVFDVPRHDATTDHDRERLFEEKKAYMAVLSGVEVGVGEVVGALVPNYVPIFASRPVSDVLIGDSKFRARTGHLISILKDAIRYSVPSSIPFFAVLHRPDSNTLYAYVLTTAHVQKGLCEYLLDRSSCDSVLSDPLSYDDPSRKSDFLKYPQVYGYFRDSLVGAPVFTGSPKCNSVRLVGFLERAEGAFQVGNVEFVKYRVFPWKGLKGKNFKSKKVEALARSLGSEELFQDSEYLVSSAIVAMFKLVKRYGVDHKLAGLAVLLSHWHLDSSKTATEASMHIKPLITIRDYLKRVALKKMDFYMEHAVVKAINECMVSVIVDVLDSEAGTLNPGEYVIGPSPRLIKSLLECVAFEGKWAHIIS